MTESMYWCFTSWGDEPIDWNPAVMTYYVWGLETCPETGKLHYQCYVELTSKKRMTWLVNNLEPEKEKAFHWEKRRGTSAQAAAYCKKDGNWEENGTLSQPHRGLEGGLLDLAADIVDGKVTTLHEACISAPAMILKYPKGVQTLLNNIKPKQKVFEPCIVEVHYGDTGTGKTKYCYENYPDLYRYMYARNGYFWDGYAGESVILFDDFSGQIDITTMLRWLDGYPETIEVKGGSTQKRWSRVLITSNKSPDEWYSGADKKHRAALKRRLTRIQYYESAGTNEPDEESSPDSGAAASSTCESGTFLGSEYNRSDQPLESQPSKPA